MNILFDSMVIKKMDSFPANSNPFHHDAYNMGVRLGKNVMAMMENHVNEHCHYVNIVNVETGERIKITFGEPEAVTFKTPETIGEQE